jgi:hypothetical protein
MGLYNAQLIRTNLIKLPHRHPHTVYLLVLRVQAWLAEVESIPSAFRHTVANTDPTRSCLYVCIGMAGRGREYPTRLTWG